MKWRPGKKVGAVHYAGNTELSDGFRKHLMDFLAWSEAKGFSEATLKNRRIELGYFVEWCEERGLERPEEVTHAILEHYRQYVFHYRRKDNQRPLSLNTQGKRLTSVRTFYQWLTRQGRIPYNVASEIDLPRRPKILPRHILTIEEVNQVLNATDIEDPTGLGIRDRAMLETLYSTGIRRGEVVALRVDDLDLQRRTVLIRQGKWSKDRVVPIGERACKWIEKYIYSIRPRYIEGEEPATLFLAKHGDAMNGKQLSGIVKKLIEKAALERFKETHPNAACHLFRHACATHMLENGADIRYIQALLGHSDLTSTEVYTNVSIIQLKAVHDKTHPAKLVHDSNSAVDES